METKLNKVFYDTFSDLPSMIFSSLWLKFKGGHTPPTHLIDDGCYGTVTLILFLAGLFYEVTSKDNYQRTLLTNYQAERINLAEDLAPSLSHIKDIELDR